MPTRSRSTTTTKKKKTGDTKLITHYTWGIYAESGDGKSTLAATSPRPMFLDSNQGLLSVEGRPGFEHVRNTPVTNWRQLENAYNNFIGAGKRDWTRFRTIVFDHFDDIQALILDELTEEAAGKDSRRQIDTTEQREWGIMLNRLRRLLRKYKSLPKHKILVFGIEEDKITGKLRPALSGKLKSQIGYFCDMIGYLYIGKKGRRWISFDETSTEHLAKCRPWWWTKEKKLIRIPNVAEDPRFLTNLFESIAAGPRGINHRGTEE